MGNIVYDGPIPSLSTIRRVSTRYQNILPLELMKRYHCIVVGAAQGILTVAITDIKQLDSIRAWEKLTGYSIFAVQIEPARMRLLLSRLERGERWHRMKFLGRPCYLHHLQVSAILLFQLEQKRERM